MKHQPSVESSQYLIDSHCHLGLMPQSETHDILKRARENKIKKLLTVSTDPLSWPINEEYARQFDSVYYTLGIHPSYALCWEEKKDELKKFLDNRHRKCVAIGEIGLDYFKYEENKKFQHQALEYQLGLSKEYNLPVSIHSRGDDAFSDFFSILKNANLSQRGVLHCFTGLLSDAKKAIDDFNFYISFSGIITFKNAHTLKDVVKHIPLDSILLETDAPYLAPDPFRGSPNEPSYLVYTANILSDIKKEPLQKVYEMTSHNCESLFSL